MSVRRVIPRLALHLTLGLLIAVPAAYLEAPTPATAAPIAYTLSDASATFGPAGGVTFTGGFTYDPAAPQGSQLESVDITATGPAGPSGPLITSPDLMTNVVFSSLDEIIFSNTTSHDEFNIEFAANLANASDSISQVLDGLFGLVSTSVSGTAVPVSVPAPPLGRTPGSLAMTGGVLALILLARRVDRRGGRT
jgi:hypothetical protein